MSKLTDRARAFLGGTQLTLQEANELWKALKGADELSLARRVIERLRGGRGLLSGETIDRRTKQKLCQQEALLTSKDSELNAARRHDLALKILAQEFTLDGADATTDAETLGIAGGILKRRWAHLGQRADLLQSALYYGRAAEQPLGDDAYPHINAAFLDDLLASLGDDPEIRRRRATAMRERIVKDLPAIPDNWFNAATRAEALFGLRRYDAASAVVADCRKRPDPWELETTARQIAAMAHMHASDPLSVPGIRAFFETLLPGAADAAQSAIVGKVGLALSGGGFRASFYHLGVLARLAELNVLRHVEVLSCVSGGSIVGACYWLTLRQRLQQSPPLTHADYITLVQDVIRHFLGAVATDLIDDKQRSPVRAAWSFLKGEKGALDPEEAAGKLERAFYGPLLPEKSPIRMQDLKFTPVDHNAALTGSPEFHAGKHNWLRANKVPILTLNATTVNTGHAWQFTPTWMGESPWAVHEAADSIPRLEWSWYVPGTWEIALSRAVAASACVPLVFAPLKLEQGYDGFTIQLVDGGVHDNQGTVSLLALDCNVVLVSDACGQLRLEAQPGPGVKGLGSYVARSMETLMERVRLGNFADLEARRRSGLLQALMFVHMKAGLDADTIRLAFSQESYTLEREKLSPSGVRKDFQQVLAELRTDLDAFTTDESHALMACGYQMAKWAFQRDLARVQGLAAEPVAVEWPFQTMLEEITSTDPTTPRREALLKALRAGG